MKPIKIIEMYKSLNNIPKIKYANGNNFFLLAGPCVIENEHMALPIARRILDITNRLEIPFVFKASYKKANRSRVDSFRGIGDEKALHILRDISEELDVPVITDVHSEVEARMAASYVDVLQIPAFLCRQTELLMAAGETGKVINIKKGQFVSGESMRFAVEKVKSTGNENIWLTERGSMFGYGDLVVDYRNIPEMQKIGLPVVLDITHSLQQPNQSSGITGGHPELIETMGRAGIAAGVDGIFLETHPKPAIAKSDGANMLQLDLLENLLEHLVAIRKTVNSFKA
jgi:2-dehydro-3-deoxyphosphooctonate aldolase (KDO 8-P synthase)